MKRFSILILLIFGILTLSVTAYNEPYGSYGPYGRSEIPTTGTSSFTYQNQAQFSGFTPYGTGIYNRLYDQLGPFDFKLSNTITNDVIKNIINNFEGDDPDLLFALADLNTNDAFDRRYLLNHYLKEDDFDCLSLDTYNALAAIDAYDRYDTIDLNNLDQDMLDREFLRRFDLTDYNKIANANPHDRIKPYTASNVNDITFDDMDCFDLRDYNTIAALKPHDKWDLIEFTDFDDLDNLDKIGRKRIAFFHQDDFAKFNLYYTRNPRLDLYAPYFYGPYDIPDGSYGLHPPLRSGNCTNANSTFCDYYVNQGYFETGSFTFNTDIRFDSNSRSSSSNSPNNSPYGARRPRQESNTHNTQYQNIFQTYTSDYSSVSTPLIDHVSPAVIPSKSTEKNTVPPPNVTDIMTLPKIKPQKSGYGILFLLSAITVVLLILILFLLRR